MVEPQKKNARLVYRYTKIKFGSNPFLYMVTKEKKGNNSQKFVTAAILYFWFLHQNSKIKVHLTNGRISISISDVYQSHARTVPSSINKQNVINTKTYSSLTVYLNRLLTISKSRNKRGTGVIVPQKLVHVPQTKIIGGHHVPKKIS